MAKTFLVDVELIDGAQRSRATVEVLAATGAEARRFVHATVRANTGPRKVMILIHGHAVKAVKGES